MSIEYVEKKSIGVDLHGKSVDIPTLGLGTYQSHGEDCYNAVLHALKVGYRHIDTASIYRNEELVGKAIKDSGIPRSDIFLVTKLNPRDHGEQQAYDACIASLERLDTDYLDMYLMHWPGIPKTAPSDPRAAEARVHSWKAFQRLYQEGKVRAIGVSNFMPWHTEKLLEDPAVTIPPACNQLELHPFLRQEKACETCAIHNIALEAYSPIARADPVLIQNSVIKQIAAAHGKTVAQVAIRWGLQKGNVVIPKSVTPSRIEENFQAATFELSQDDMAAIDELDSNFRTCWDPNTVTN